MKRKAILAVLTAAILAISSIAVFALDYAVPEDATYVTARFIPVDPDTENSEFTMVSEDGEWTIHVTDETIIYFEDVVPLGDDGEGYTEMVREVLFDRTLAEVLNGRNMRVIFVEADDEDVFDAISIKVLFEIAVHLPGVVGIADLGDINVNDNDLNENDLNDNEAVNDEVTGGQNENGYQTAVTLPATIDDLVHQDMDPIVLNGELVVIDEILTDTKAPFVVEVDGSEVVMIPLRAVVEQFDLEPVWDGEVQSIRLGVATHIWIGRNEAHVGRMAPIELSTAPVLVDGSTFVPLDFFRNVLGLTAYVFEGQVVVTDSDDMF